MPGVGRASVVFRRPPLSPQRPPRLRFPVSPLLQSLLARRKMSLRRIPNAPQSAQHHPENIPVVVVRKQPPPFGRFDLIFFRPGLELPVSRSLKGKKKDLKAAMAPSFAFGIYIVYISGSSLFATATPATSRAWHCARRPLCTSSPATGSTWIWTNRRWS